MKNNQGVKMIAILVCTLCSLAYFLHFKNAPKENIFLAGAVIWLTGAIVNITMLIISNKKNKVITD